MPLASLLHTSWAGPSQEVPKTPRLLIVDDSAALAKVEVKIIV
jgi:hypothetical protein